MSMAIRRLTPLSKQERAFLTVHDPSGCFPRNGEFSSFDFFWSLGVYKGQKVNSGIWPEGMIVREANGKFYKVENSNLTELTDEEIREILELIGQVSLEDY